MCFTGSSVLCLQDFISLGLKRLVLANLSQPFSIKARKNPPLLYLSNYICRIQSLFYKWHKRLTHIFRQIVFYNCMNQLHHSRTVVGVRYNIKDIGEAVNNVWLEQMAITTVYSSVLYNIFFNLLWLFKNPL